MRWFLALQIIFGSTSEQKLSIPWHQHVLVPFCWFPSFLWACSRYTLQRVYLANSAKLCVHVHSTLYAFVSKLQCWLINERESGENLQCVKIPRKPFTGGVHSCKSVVPVSVWPTVYSCSALSTVGPWWCHLAAKCQHTHL